MVEEDPPLGDSPGDTTLVGDSLPSSKLFAARAATAEAFSLSSGLILQMAWGSGTQLPRMELIWSSDTGDRGGEDAADIAEHGADKEKGERKDLGPMPFSILPPHMLNMMERIREREPDKKEGAEEREEEGRW